MVLTAAPGHRPGDEPAARTMSRAVIDNVARRDPQFAGEIGETRNPRLQAIPEFRQDLAFMVLNRLSGQAAYLSDFNVLHALFQKDKGLFRGAGRAYVTPFPGQFG